MSTLSSRLAACLRACLAPRHRFLLALAISLGAHLVFLFPPSWVWWHRPQPLPEITRLDVTLKAVPSPQPAPPPAPVPQPPAPVSQLPAPTTTPVAVEAPHIEALKDAPPVPPAPETVETPEAQLAPDRVETLEGVETSEKVEAPETVETLETPLAQAESDEALNAETKMILPRGGLMRYLVYRGDQGFEIGRAELQWRVDDGRYYLGLHTETSGLAALLHPVAADATSVGGIGPDGLQPERYTLIRDDKNVEEVAFSWEVQILQIGARDPVLLHPGSQDILSLQYQFAYMLSPMDTVMGHSRPLEFWVANDKRYELIRFEILGKENLTLPAGGFRTLHLQSVGSDKTIDFWLAEDYQMLPIKTRFTDKHGEIYEQALSALQIEDGFAPNAGHDSLDPNIYPELPPDIR